jgi:hypothetical protein
MEARRRLVEGDSDPKREHEERLAEDARSKPGFSFSGKRVHYQIDKSSRISASASLGVKEGDVKLRRFNIQYRKDF